MDFIQLLDDEGNVRCLGEKHFHLRHLDCNQVLNEGPRVNTVWLVDQIRRVHSLIDEVHVSPLPQILRGFAIDGIVQQLVKIFLHFILGGRANLCGDGEIRLHTPILGEQEHTMRLLTLIPWSK